MTARPRTRTTRTAAVAEAAPDSVDIETIPGDEMIPDTADTLEIPTFVPTDSADPDAPYGRKADGTPKRKPGRQPGGSAGAPRTTVPRPARRPGARTRPATGSVDYRQGIAGILQIPAFVLVGAGRFNPALEYDGAAIAVHTPSIAEALNQLAQDEPRVAAVLEKVLSVGPYGAILGATLPLVAQILVNHKRVPLEAVAALGAVEPDRLISREPSQAA